MSSSNASPGPLAATQRSSGASAEPSAVRDLVAYALDGYWDELAWGHVELDVIGRQMVRELRVLARIANAELKALSASDTLRSDVSDKGPGTPPKTFGEPL